MSAECTWYVDPLDGTTNFAHGFPMFNVTLAVERAGELIAGVVYHPIHDEMFAAEAGGGAYLNNRRIHVSKVARVEDALVATGFPSRKRHENVNVHFYYQLAMMSHGVRRAGSAARPRPIRRRSDRSGSEGRAERAPPRPGALGPTSRPATWLLSGA